jgi:hypothetical protein
MPKKRSQPEPAPTTTISNCTFDGRFTFDAKHAEAANSLALAAKANAEAIAEVAKSLRALEHSGPMLQIGM